MKLVIGLSSSIQLNMSSSGCVILNLQNPWKYTPLFTLKLQAEQPWFDSRLWGPPSLLSIGYRGSFPSGKGSGAWIWPLTCI